MRNLRFQISNFKWLCRVACDALSCLAIFWSTTSILADGKVVPPRDYKGSLEEKAQEAIIIFHSSETAGEAMEDLILKIQVAGRADRFAWVVPLPNEPKIGKEDPKLFAELFSYVESRRHRPSKNSGAKSAEGEHAKAEGKEPVELLSRQTVGEFDISVVRENESGGLNPWLEKEGYQKLENADDVLDFYRKKGYVYACVKVSSEALAKGGQIESHPLRFTFATGGRDGIFFPMKLTGLQSEPFDVNLYVFYGAWLNDKLSKFGYEHRGFRLRHRDWDTRECVPNGGKSYSLPGTDPYLKSEAHRVPTVTKLVQKLHPGEKYYLTNIEAHRLVPSDVRSWSDDLWLFPYYTDKNMVPHDARSGGPASAAWPGLEVNERGAAESAAAQTAAPAWKFISFAVVSVCGLAALAVAALVLLRARVAPAIKPGHAAK
jgi:hypothetical protein